MSERRFSLSLRLRGGKGRVRGETRAKNRYYLLDEALR